MTGNDLSSQVVSHAVMRNCVTPMLLLRPGYGMNCSIFVRKKFEDTNGTTATYRSVKASINRLIYFQVRALKENKMKKERHDYLCLSSLTRKYVEESLSSFLF